MLSEQQVGCGPGRGFQAIKDHTSAQIIAVDYSAEMVQRASPRAVRLGVHTAVDDAQVLSSIKTGLIDRLLATLCIHIVPDPHQALQAFLRVLKPGGVMCASVWGQPQQSSQFSLLPDAIEECRKRGLIPAPAEPRLPKRSQFHLGQDDDALRQMLEKAGFEGVTSWHVFCVWPHCCDGAQAFVKSWLESQPLSPEVTGLTQEQRLHLEAVMVELAETVLASGQPIGCDIVCVCGRKPVFELNDHN